MFCFSILFFVDFLLVGKCDYFCANVETFSNKNKKKSYFFLKKITLFVYRSNFYLLVY